MHCSHSYVYLLNGSVYLLNASVYLCNGRENHEIRDLKRTISESSVDYSARNASAGKPPRRASPATRQTRARPR